MKMGITYLHIADHLCLILTPLAVGVMFALKGSCHCYHLTQGLVSAAHDEL